MIKNNTEINENINNMELVGKIDIDSGELNRNEIVLHIPENELMPYTDIYEGLDEKVIGLYILYSEGLEVENMGIYVDGK